MVKKKLIAPEKLRRLAGLLDRRFIQRRTLYARQTRTGYVSVKRPLRRDHLVAHLRGHLTLGTYLLDADSNGRFLVFDADDAPQWHRLQTLARVLADQGATGYLENSRRGGHLWYFWQTPQSGAALRAFGLGVLACCGIDGIELFPKQARLGSGPGSLIRLPFGIHRKSGKRYGFYLPDGSRLAPTLSAQITALATAATVPNGVQQQFATYAPSLRQKAEIAPVPGRRRPVVVAADAPVSQRIKMVVSVREFVLRYVELSPRGQGLCPFHEDRVESFSVNDAENYWHCFACGTGGSVIDFWMQWQKCDFKTAVRELADMLL